MADNIYSRRGGGILGRGVYGEVPPDVSAGDQYRQYQRSMVPPPNQLISGAEEFMRQAARERAASPENAVKRGLDAGQVSGAEYADRAMSARQDEILRQAEMQAIADLATPREMQAIADLATPSLLQEAPARAAPTMPSEDQIGSLLGNIDWQGLLRVFARPEFLQAGVSPAQAFVGAAFAQRQADAASRAAAQAQQLEYGKLQADLAKEQIKGAPQPPKPSAEITQLYTKLASGQESLKALNKMQGIISEGTPTGGAALGVDFITNLAAAFNINIGETDKANLNRQVDKVRSALIASRAFGREANKQEQKLIENLLPKGGTFTNVDELRNAYRDFQAYIENDVKVTSGILQNVYRLPSFSQAVPDNIPAFTRGNR